MIIDYFPATVAADESGNVARNAEAQVYALSDTAFSSPLALTDLQGVPMPGLVSSDVGIYPPFRVVAGTLQIVVVSGSLRTPMTSLSVYANAAEAAASMASGNAGAALTSANAAELARINASAAATAAEQAATEAAAVGATTDAQIANRINTPGSQTEVALGNKIGARVRSTKAAGEGVAEPDVLRVSTWDAETDFLIRLPVPSAIAAGSEFILESLGAGQGMVVAAEENLFPYPDAEAGFSGGIWQSRGSAVLSVAVGVAPGGADAIRVTATGASSSGGFGHGGALTGTWFLSDMGVKSGDQLSARAWLAPPVGQNGRIQFRFFRGATILSDVATVGTLGTGFRTALATVPDGATHFAIVSYSTATASGVTSDISLVRVVRGSVPPSEHIDGGSPNGVWWGDAHVSPSSVGRVLGDTAVVGRSILRYEGGGIWRVVPVSAPADALRASDTLAIDRDNGQQGMFAPSIPFATSDTALTTGRVYVTRVMPSRDMLIQGIGFRVTTASTTDDAVDVGIYSAAGARIASSGAVSGYLNSAGQKTVPFPGAMLTAGQVYYAALSSASTASIRRGTVLADAFGSAIPALESGYASTSHPIPATMPSLTAADAAVLFTLREHL